MRFLILFCLLHSATLWLLWSPNGRNDYSAISARILRRLAECVFLVPEPFSAAFAWAQAVLRSFASQSNQAYNFYFAAEDLLIQNFVLQKCWAVFVRAALKNLVLHGLGSRRVIATLMR